MTPTKAKQMLAMAEKSLEKSKAKLDLAQRTVAADEALCTSLRTMIGPSAAVKTDADVEKAIAGGKRVVVQDAT